MFVYTLIFIAGATAVPEFDFKSIDLRDERAVNYHIKKAFEETSQYIKDAGYDPLYIEKRELRYALPVPVIFNTSTTMENLTSHGLSNIQVNSATFSFVSSRVNFDITLPLINFSLGAGNYSAGCFGRTFNIKSSGKVEFQRMRFIGQMRLKISLATGITVRSVKMNFTMDGIDSDVKLVAQDVDYSDKMNNFLNTTVPETFKEYSAEINELLEIFTLDYMNTVIFKPSSNSTLSKPKPKP